jgi:2-phosphosulfolactate phosphatase
MVHALGSGCREVVPCLEIDEAVAVANWLGRNHAILGGEREGLTIPGFDLGNSPDSYSPEICRGKTVVMTTTNGTRAILACQEACRVLVASFGNLEATIAVIRSQQGGHVAVVCAGTNGEISHEDTLLAGAIVAGVTQNGSASGPREGAFELGNDSALIALSHWRRAEWEMSQCDSLESILERGKGGRRVREIGLAADIAAAARMNHQPMTAELHRDPLRIVAAGVEGPSCGA